MGRKETRVALLKVLASAAWADGHVDSEEVNHIKELALKAGLDNADLGEIDGILAQPIPNTQCESLTRDLLQELRTDQDRQDALDALDELFRADGEVDENEERLLHELRGVMASANALDGFLSRVTGVFRGVFGNQSSGPGALAKTLSNAVIARLDHLSQGKWANYIDEKDLNQHALYAAVLGKVADIHEGKSGEEMDEINSALHRRRGLGPPVLDWLVEAVRDAVTGEMDRQRLLSEFNRNAEMEERHDLLDAAFSVAAADGTVAPQELEELRLISNFLWIDARDFNAIRKRWDQAV